MSISDWYTTQSPVITSSPTLSPTVEILTAREAQACPGQESGGFAFMYAYGSIFTILLIWQSITCFLEFNNKRKEFRKLKWNLKAVLYLKDVWKKFSLFFMVEVYIWNNASDIGSLIVVYNLSQTDCSLGYTLLWRLFALCLSFVVFYRVFTASLALYASQKPMDFFAQLFDYLAIKVIDINYIFDTGALDEVQTWILYTCATLQSFPIMITSFGIMAATRDYANHPLLITSLMFSILLTLVGTAAHDRIIFKEESQHLRFRPKHIGLVPVITNFSPRAIWAGKCCTCDEIIRTGYIYRVLFRVVDYQLRVFILEFIWVTYGGFIMSFYIIFETILIYLLIVRPTGKWHFFIGLLGMVINFTSEKARKLTFFFSIYRVVTNVLWLVAILIAVYVKFEISLSAEYKDRRIDFFHSAGLFYYLCVLCVVHPWLYFGLIRGGGLIDEEFPAVDSRDAQALIKKGDFWTFLQLCVFGNHFPHGNEWVLQGLLDHLESGIKLVPLRYWELLLRAYDWDFKKITMARKSQMYCSILQHDKIEVTRLLFYKTKHDMEGVDAAVFYWCQEARMEGDYMVFFRTCKLIDAYFQVANFRPHTQAALLKYSFLRGLQAGNIDAFKGVLHYRIHKDALKYLYLHYTDINENLVTPTLFAQMLHALHSISQLLFLPDGATAKCFLYWAVKLQLWPVVFELIKNVNFNKQIHSAFFAKGETFLHILCDTHLENKAQIEEICKVAEYLIRKLNIRLKKPNGEKETPLMYACRALNFQMVKLLIKYGADPSKRNQRRKEGCLNYIDMYESRQQRLKSAREDMTVLRKQSQDAQDAQDVQAGSEQKYDEDDEDDKAPEPEELPAGRGLYKTALEIEMAVLNRRLKSIMDSEQYPQDVNAVKRALRKILANAKVRSRKDEEFLEIYSDIFNQFWSRSKNTNPIRYAISKHMDNTAMFDLIYHADCKQLLKVVRRYNMDVNQPMTTGKTPLHYACEFSDPFTVKLLVDLDAYTIAIQNDELVPLASDLVKKNKTVSPKEREIIKRILAVKDPKHNPFRSSDERIIEFDRITLFFSLFCRYFVILFVVFSICFLISSFGADYFNIGYYKAYAGKIYGE